MKYFSLYKNSWFDDIDECKRHNQYGKSLVSLEAVLYVYSKHKDGLWSVNHISKVTTKPVRFIISIFEYNNLKVYPRSHFKSSTNSLRNATTTEKYGVDNISQDPTTKNKKVSSSLANYGTDNPMKSDTVKSKVTNTVKDKYGVDSISQCESSKQKAIETNLVKYGTTHPKKNKNIQTKCKDNLIKKYGVDNYTKSEEYKNQQKKNRFDKLVDICFNLGIPNPTKEELSKITLPDNPTKNYMLMCMGRKKLDRGILHNHFRYNHNKVLHKIDGSLDLTRTSQEEYKITNFLRSIGVDYTTHNRSILNGKELDIVIGDRLAIEVNGLYWHSSQFKPSVYHLDKLNMCENANIQLLQFTDTQINTKFEIVKSIIKSKLGITDRIYARNCNIEEITSKQARIFHTKNHIDGYAPSSIHYALYYNNNITQVISLSKSRFMSNYDYELVRLSSVLGVTVVGGMSRLIRRFVSVFGDSVYSYANRDISNGKSYNSCSFKFIRNTPPSYKFLVNGILESRQKYQKHKLLSMFPDYDGSDVSLFLANKGIYKYYTTGNILYVLK